MSKFHSMLNDALVRYALILTVAAWLAGCASTGQAQPMKSAAAAHNKSQKG